MPMTATSTNPERFRVTGLHCASCVRRLETALGDLPGVDAARVNLADASATVAFGSGLTAGQLMDAARDAGFPMEPEVDDTLPPDETPDLKRDTDNRRRPGLCRCF